MDTAAADVKLSISMEQNAPQEQQEAEGGSVQHHVVVAEDDPQMFAEAMEMKAALDQELEDEMAADSEEGMDLDELEDMPNTVFVPLKTIEPEVDPREVVIFIIMLPPSSGYIVPLPICFRSGWVVECAGW